MSTAPRPFAALSAADQRRAAALAHAFAPTRWPDADAARAELGGVEFEGGATCFTLWDGPRPRALLAIVVREVPIKAEAFITAVTVAEDDPRAFPPLLAAALACLDDPDAVRVALGVAPRPHLAALVAAAGFAHHEDALRMSLRGPDPALAPPAGFAFTPLAADDPEVFRQVANAAFRAAPNGATLDPGEVAALRAGAAHPDLVGTYRQGAAPVAFHLLKLGGDAGEIGEIDSLGVVPARQGRGLGGHLLAAAVATLRGHGARAIVLGVMSSNTRAVRLYERRGFVTDAVAARWYVRRPTPRSA
ncbi:MAG: hypothetical protein CVU56_28735 [Deltaproteobacteria bacterium HGW-Deltaproteobacteria-14]|jgi:ribosomal protein S18 acetylase RimI-like enzyme|nr:MAG: hypothetical protein CVU56_28735 [Deltaproteobacteria bacterium HGW-Deltaproteobacteria-14]